MIVSRFLTEKETTAQIKRLFQRAKTIKCAVAFWGEHAVEALAFPEETNTVRIICNFDIGATNPKVIRQLNEMDHVEIRSHPQLHAKVYWTGQGAIVGSSNASANGLSLEGNELNGWIEANLLVSDQDTLTRVETWFDNLWLSAKPITEAQIKLVEEKWKKRRHHRPVIFDPKKSLLTELKHNRESFKDQPIMIAIYRKWVSETALETLEYWKKQQQLPVPVKIGIYENWSILPPGGTLIDLYYGPKGGVQYTGLWFIPDPIIEYPVLRKNVKRGHITICHKRKDFEGLVISSDDKTLLRNKVAALFKEGCVETDNAALISLYDAWPFLFD